MNIYIVRHCKADGQSPSANLTEEGYKQANRLAEFLCRKNIEYIYSSPFVRAIDLIFPLAQKLQVNLITDDRLSERILCSENHPNWREMIRTHGNLMSLLFKYYDSKIGFKEWEALSNPDAYHLKIDGISSPIIQRIWR